MSILDLFRFSDGVAEEIAAGLDQEFETFPPQSEPTILDRSASVVSEFLSHARAEKARLEAEIAERTERLRQTVVAIEAFEPVLAKLDDGYDPSDDARKSYDVAIETKRRRGDRHYRKPVLAAAE